MDDLWLLIFLFHSLEIQLGKHVQIVGELDNVEHFVQEAHRVVWESFPKAGIVRNVRFTNDHLNAPQE